MIDSGDIRVLVAQENGLLRNALIGRLEQEPWIEACAAASGIEEARELVELHRPHVLVINVSLNFNTGTLSLRRLRRDFPELAVVALSCNPGFENVCAGQAFRAGANGFVSCRDSVEDLVQAIYAAWEEEGRLGRCTEKRYRPGAAAEKGFAKLSRREAEVYCLAGYGHVSKRIAEKMAISGSTVDSYLERIRRKMNLANRAELQYSATRFMLGMARRGMDGVDDRVIQELIST